MKSLAKFVAALATSATCAATILVPPPAHAEIEGAKKCYPDDHGKAVCFPLGDLSFADELVDYEPGDRVAEALEDRDPQNVLGIPGEPEGSSGKSLTLGCGGTVTVRFADNAIVDLPGADLHLFEIGPDEEATRLEISKDGEDWIYVGRVWGGRADIDIAWATTPGESFRYVRVTDLKYACDSRWPGADLDAIGAIGSATRLTIDSGVLFDVDKAVLRPEAASEIARVAEAITAYRATRVSIGGHTDSDGSDAHNLDLSKRRAESVRDALGETGALRPDIVVEAAGYGETRPAAANDTAANKQKNRRVEILVVPGVAPDAAHGDAEGVANTRPGVPGEWTRNDAKMTIAEPADGVTAGTYTSDGGRIFGHVDGHILEGHWVENGSKVACDTEKDGSRHWGRLRMEFDEDFVRYRADWAYCDRPEWQGEYTGHWTG